MKRIKEGMKKVNGCLNRFIKCKLTAYLALGMFVVIGFLAGTVVTAMAVAAPVTGTFAYDVYDIGINKILNGPIGFTAGVGAMAVGAVSAIQQRIAMAVGAILGGAVLLNAESLVTTLGAIF
jgi:hypothetical protein